MYPTGEVINGINTATTSVSAPITSVGIPSLSIEEIFIAIAKVIVGGRDYEAVQDFYEFFSLVKFSLTFISLLLIVLIIYVLFATAHIKKLDKEKYAVVDREKEKVVIKNARWQKVLEHSESGNPNDWRLAILEADIMLDDMLTGMGYNHETLGEKLKAADPIAFPKLQQAWEAHKMRNVLAHEGTDFELSQRETRRIIALYKEVFEAGLYV